MCVQGYGGELDYDKEMGAMDRKDKQGRQQGKFKDRASPGQGKGMMNKKRATKDAKYGELCYLLGLQACIVVQAPQKVSD